MKGWLRSRGAGALRSRIRDSQDALAAANPRAEHWLDVYTAYIHEIPCWQRQGAACSEALRKTHWTSCATVKSGRNTALEAIGDDSKGPGRSDLASGSKLNKP